MSPRQREFCRHYLRGLSAAEAARAAGYAACTAEKNAAEILRTPSVQAWLQRHRAASVIITQADLTLLREQLTDMICTGTAHERIQTGYQLLALARLQHRLPPEALPSEDTHNSPINPAQNPAQTPENQSSYPTPPPIPETDTLPDGEEAFDKRLAPEPPKPKKSRQPISVRMLPRADKTAPTLNLATESPPPTNTPPSTIPLEPSP